MIELWTSRQRLAVTAIVASLAVFLVGRLAFNRTFISDPQPVEPPLASTLADRIDLNTADAATLGVLPNVGPSRAAAIVATRERLQSEQGRRDVFRSPADLDQVRGFGPAMIEHVAPFLMFPATAPTTSSEKEPRTK